MLHKWVWWEVGCLICASACAAAAVYQACLCEPSFGGSGAGSEAASTEGQDGAVLPRAGRGVGASSAGRTESPPFRDTFILFRSECGRSDVCNAHPCCPVHPGNTLKATPGVQRGCAVTSAEAASRQGGHVWWTRSPAQLLLVLGAGAEMGSWCPTWLHRLMPDLKAVGTVCFMGWPTQELHVLVPLSAMRFVTAVLRVGCSVHLKSVDSASLPAWR